MKKLLTSAGLVAMGVSGLHAAYAPTLTSMETSKPWSVSAALRGFYDDNYTTSPNGLKRSTVGYEVSPSASLNLPLDQTFIGLSYEYSLRYFEDRRNHKYDQSHKFDARLDHAFSERYKLELSDSFVIAQEPEVLNPGIAATPLRTKGNNIRNLGSISFTAQLTELFGLEFRYQNTFYDYQQNFHDTAPMVSRSALLDRDEHLAAINARWQIAPETVGILGYQFGFVDFSSQESIGMDPMTLANIASDVRNSRSHYLYVGADHRFNSQLNASVRVGAQYVDYYKQHKTAVGPYADASLTYQYAPGDSVQAGIRHTRASTDVATINSAGDVTSAQEVTALYAQLNHRITPHLLGSLLVQGQRGTFERGSANGDVEYYFLTTANLAYQINNHLLAEAGYNFDYVNSDQPGRDYTRNRVYLGIRATY